MHVIKNLNINSKLFSKEVKNPNFLISLGDKLCFHVVPCSCDSSLIFVIPTLLWNCSSPSQVKGSIPQSFTAPYWSEMNHSPKLSVFAVDLKGAYATGFPCKSPCCRQGKLRGIRLTVVSAIVLGSLGLLFSLFGNNTQRGKCSDVQVPICGSIWQAAEVRLM